MHVEELVESILASVQWDRWRFYMPFAKPLLKQDVAVVSHDDLDHWHPNFYQKDLVLVPWKLKVPPPFTHMRNIMKVDDQVRVAKLTFQQVDARLLRHVLFRQITPPHAFWWVVSCNDVRILFIGDINVPDLSAIKTFVDAMFVRRHPLHAALLPSFGGVSTHGARYPSEPSIKIRELANYVRSEYGIMVGALPHPVPAEWADYNGYRLI